MRLKWTTDKQYQRTKPEGDLASENKQTKQMVHLPDK